MLLRRWREGDAALLARLGADRRVVRCILDGSPWSGDDERDRGRGGRQLGVYGCPARLGMTLELTTTGRAGETVSVYRLSRDDWRRVRRGTNR